MSLNIPIVRIEIEHARQSILLAFSELQLEQDRILRDELARYCSEENIRMIMRDAVETTIRNAITEEVKNFYTYGEGRELLAAAVAKKLSEE